MLDNRQDFGILVGAPGGDFESKLCRLSSNDCLCNAYDIGERFY
jgi:hypothetical protein